MRPYTDSHGRSMLRPVDGESMTSSGALSSEPALSEHTIRISSRNVCVRHLQHTMGMSVCQIVRQRERLTVGFGGRGCVSLIILQARQRFMVEVFSWPKLEVRDNGGERQIRQHGHAR